MFFGGGGDIRRRSGGCWSPLVAMLEASI